MMFGSAAQQNAARGSAESCTSFSLFRCSPFRCVHCLSPFLDLLSTFFSTMSSLCHVFCLLGAASLPPEPLLLPLAIHLQRCPPHRGNRSAHRKCWVMWESTHHCFRTSGDHLGWHRYPLYVGTSRQSSRSRCPYPTCGAGRVLHERAVSQLSQPLVQLLLPLVQSKHGGAAASRWSNEDELADAGAGSGGLLGGPTETSMGTGGQGTREPQRVLHWRWAGRVCVLTSSSLGCSGTSPQRPCPWPSPPGP